MITFNNVSKIYQGGVEAVKDLSMEVQEGELMVLLGTSGCGKTTTLKMVNRLIEPTDGQILIEDEDIMDTDPIELRRNIGYAIQHIGLFPHMTVGENIAVVPRLLNWDDNRVSSRVEQLLDMVGLPAEDFYGRFPVQLSGGQRQRIGVARCLAADPPLILMDEPFGALDPITREVLQEEFLDLETQIEKTIIFVTHDIFEAVKMGDRIALMDDGKLQQLATPTELVENPANEFVDRFLGQHRFQLSLLTRKVEDAMEMVDDSTMKADKETLRDYSLKCRNSLVEALDTFKKSAKSRLPVYGGNNEYKGSLSKKILLRMISQTLGEAGESEAGQS